MDIYTCGFMMLLWGILIGLQQAALHYVFVQGPVNKDI